MLRTGSLIGSSMKSWRCVVPPAAMIRYRPKTRKLIQTDETRTAESLSDFSSASTSLGSGLGRIVLPLFTNSRDNNTTFIAIFGKVPPQGSPEPPQVPAVFFELLFQIGMRITHPTGANPHLRSS